MENTLTNKLNALKMDHTKETEDYKKRLQDLAEKKEAEVTWNVVGYLITFCNCRGKNSPTELQH